MVIDSRDQADHDTNPGNQALQHSQRYPAFSVLVCFAVGILLDAWLNLAVSLWLLTTIGFYICWVATYRLHKKNISTVCILLVVICLGALRYHDYWNCRTQEHITRLLPAAESHLNPGSTVRLTGTVSSKPEIRELDENELLNPQQPQRRVQFTLDCQNLLSENSQVPVSGKIRVFLTEDVRTAESRSARQLMSGDLIDVSGELNRCAVPDNPEDFDFSIYFRKQKIDATLSVKFPEAVILLQSTKKYSWSQVSSSVQDHFRELIVEHTSQSTQPVALALLLGDRTHLSSRVRQQFSQAGLIHFLAISGLHIGFFSAFIWSICHLLNLPRKLTVILLVLSILFYLSIIDVRPPVIRAASFCVLVTLGIVNWRTITTINLVCVSALLILMINPTDLFDVGTQLSFLAVAAILWTVNQEFYKNLYQQTWLPLRWRLIANDPLLQTPLQKAGFQYFRMLYSVFLITFFIWLTTAPLVLYHFNLLTPVGLVVNTLIFPFLFLILLLGYLLIFFGSLLPFTAGVTGFCFNQSLVFLLGVVAWTSKIPFASFELPAPPLWWLVLYYALLLLSVIPGIWKYRWLSVLPARKVRLSLLPIWVLAGLTVPLLHTEPPSLHCTFIAVNHGASILIESPDGETILYDAGSMSPVEQTSSKIRKTLLSRGIRRVDLLLISHADRDHFNCAAELIEKGYVSKLAFPQAFLANSQRGTSELCDAALTAGVPVKLVAKGDAFHLGKETRIEVLHPEYGDQYREDNPSSLTLCIEYSGRQFLLTGDLEGDGLKKLLKEPANDNIDVLLSPHHGSRSANTRELNEWAKPEYVIVSGGRKQTISELRQTYAAGTQIYATRQHGAIVCEVDPTGNLTVTPFRGDSTHHNRLDE